MYSQDAHTSTKKADPTISKFIEFNCKNCGEVFIIDKSFIQKFLGTDNQ